MQLPTPLCAITLKRSCSLPFSCQMPSAPALAAWLWAKVLFWITTFGFSLGLLLPSPKLKYWSMAPPPWVGSRAWFPANVLFRISALPL